METLTYLLSRAAELGCAVPPYQMPPQKWITTGNNVREGPGVGYRRIRTIDAGIEVTFLREEKGWAEIAPGEWVSMQYLRKVE